MSFERRSLKEKSKVKLGVVSQEGMKESLQRLR